MRRNSKIISSILAAGIILIVGLSFWMVAESKNTSATPQEALLTENENLLLIPAYVNSSQALFFFIENEKQLGAVKVHKGVLGWKADFRTWSPIGEITATNEIPGYQVHGEKVAFGLLKDADESAMMLDDIPSIKVNLEVMLYGQTEELNLQGLYLWYYEADDLSEVDQLRLVHQRTNEEIDARSFH